MQYEQSWEFALWFFVLIARLRAKEQFALFKEQIALAALFKRATGANVVFYKEQEERWRAIRSFVLGTKEGKAGERTNLKQITLKKSKSLFHKEQIAPVTHSFKTTFSPVSFLKSERAKERIPNPDWASCRERGTCCDGKLLHNQQPYWSSALIYIIMG